MSEEDGEGGRNRKRTRLGERERKNQEGQNLKLLQYLWCFLRIEIWILNFKMGHLEKRTDLGVVNL